MKRHEEFDNLLDQALSEYSSAEPLSGLEERVLQRLRMQPQPGFLAWRKWGLVGACAAVLVIAGWLGWRAHDRQVEPTQGAAVVTTPQPSSPANQAESRAAAHPASPALETRESARPLLAKSRPAVSVHRSEPPTHMASERSLDLQDFTQYPQEPAPLTTQEQALVALAQARPDALGTMTQAGQRIAIAPIAVEPLPSEAKTEGEN